MQALARALLLLAGLAGPIDLRAQAPAPAARPSTEATHVVVAALDAVLFDYLGTRYSASQVAALRAAARPADFSRQLRALTGKDVVQLGEEIMSDAERKAGAATASTGVVTTVTAGPFVLRAPADTPGGRDLAQVGAAMDSAFRRTASALALDARVKAALEQLNGGTIEVVLHPNRQGEREKALGSRGFGKTSFGATIQEGRARLTTRIQVLYLNALSLAVAEHEAAHAAVLLGTFDTAAFVARGATDGDKLKAAFFASYRKIPTFIQEGIGDWAIYSGGLYETWGVFQPVDTLVRELREAGQTLPLEELVAGDIRFRASRHKVYSLEAASLLDYLFRAFGADRVRAWLLSGDTNGVKSFAAVFGRSLRDVEAAWTAGTGVSIRLSSE